MKFVSLFHGPTVQWGPDVLLPSGITIERPFCTLNLWAIGEDGKAYALTHDATLERGQPKWVAFDTFERSE